jgi:signal transduction histidine kinase
MAMYPEARLGGASASEQQLRAIFDNANDAILLIDPDDDRIIEANAQASRMLGYGQSELTSAVRISSVHPHEMERLRQFAHDVRARPSASPTRIDLDALIRELEPALRGMPAAVGRVLEVKLGRDDCHIHADPKQLSEMLVNLVVNACEAVGLGDRVTLIRGRMPGAETPVIEVRNGGEPIPAEVLARIGQPFFSTKASGNGLGVAYVRRVAAAHHWEFSLESAPETGTVARLLL